MSNTTVDLSCSRALVRDMPKGLAWLLAFYMIVLALVTVVENIVVILATVSNKRQLATTIGKVFLSLAITDLITGTVVMPCYAISLFLGNMDSEPSCLLKTVLFTFGFTATTVSLMTLIVISLNRLVSVLKPHVYQHGGSKSWLWLASFLFVWAYSLIMVFPHHFGAWSRRIFVIWFSVTILITVTVPPAIYYYILLRAGKRTASVMPHSNGPNQRKTNQFMSRQRRISYSCFLTTAILIGMYLPQLVARVIEALSVISSASTMQILLGLTNAVSLTNSAVNPWIYAVRNTAVRNTIINKLLGQNRDEFSSHGPLSSQGRLSSMRRRDNQSAISETDCR